MDDFLKRIDEVTELACGWCKTPLAESAPSLDFCTPEHQALWTKQHGEPIVGYREAGLGAMDYESYGPAASPLAQRIEQMLSGLNAAMERLAEPSRCAANMFQVFGRALADWQADLPEWSLVGWIDGDSPGLAYDPAPRRRPARDGVESHPGDLPSYPTVPIVRYPTINPGDFITVDDVRHKVLNASGDGFQLSAPIFDEPVRSGHWPHPDDPSLARAMEAALEARRTRNTGPKQATRVPKRLDGKGRR